MRVHGVLPRARYDCEAALNIDHTSASNSDRLVAQQAIGRVIEADALHKFRGGTPLAG
jgi:hypothetical protein